MPRSTLAPRVRQRGARMPDCNRRLTALVHGRVQGVGFRHFAVLRAGELGVTGYVRNRADGCVEVVAEGEQAPLDRFLEHLRVGPRMAVVSRVEAAWSPAAGEFTDFDSRFF